VYFGSSLSSFFLFLLIFILKMHGYDKLCHFNSKIKDIFDLFDRDGNGVISSSELENVLKKLGKNPTETDVQNILKEVLKNILITPVVKNLRIY